MQLRVVVLPAASNNSEVQIQTEKGTVVATLKASVVLDNLEVNTTMFDGNVHKFSRSLEDYPEVK